MLLVFIISAPIGEVVDHVQDPGVVTNNVKVPIVDEGPVVLKTEHDILTTVIHEVVDHGEVNVSGVGELQVTNMKSTSKEKKSEKQDSFS